MDPLSIGVAFSVHLGFYPEDFNSTHPYVQMQLNPTLSVGAMVNSEYSVSMYIRHTQHIHNRMTMDLGAVTGYDNIPVVPMIRLNYEWDNNYSYWIMPGYHEQHSTGRTRAGIVLGVQFKF